MAVTPRNIYSDPNRDAKFLPTGWKRIQLDYPLDIVGGRATIHSYEMRREIQEWCLEQFGYAPVIFEFRNEPEFPDPPHYVYSTVFTDANHAVAFTLQWL